MKVALFFFVIPAALLAGNISDSDRIQPWRENPFYWQYKGRPVLLLGGTDDDNLFQWPAEALQAQLDALRAVGGNYVRNTMSDRKDRGFEIYPFAQLAGGKYDLERWNPEYWERFERFLAWTTERDVLVQIEIWDRFDYSREHWLPHPFNPKNNVNYTHEESGLAAEYPDHPGTNSQPFFFTTPGQHNNPVVLKYQRLFVHRLLSHSLKYGHVLYCMDNETKADEEWGRYWADYVREKARQAGVRVCLTEMWDDWDIRAERHRRTLDHPERYDFADVSQNNHNSGQQHWENALWVRQYVAGQPRPINTVKTYGADGNKFGHTDRDGLERYWRHILAGFAAARFHRPDSGLGLNEKAQAAIRAARKLESLVRMWELSPRQDLLSEREENETYLAASPGKAYVLYFTDGGAIRLEIPPGHYAVHWISLDASDRSGHLTPESDGRAALAAPDSGHWLAVVLKK